jgi:NAD(P)-dependent dehydrogenase (short-subunit alcohol dehydrogenase family)
MTKRLKGKIAWVNGASRGIGLAIARAFAREGATLAISSRKKDAIDEAARKIEADFEVPVLSYACHMAAPEQVEGTYAGITDALGVPSILVNNGGTSPYFGPFLDAPEALWDKTFEVNLKGPFWATRLVVKGLMEQGNGGSIINTASIQGTLGAPYQGVYAMTKSALISMTQTLALELGPSGIRVNAIAPGLVQTRLAAALTDNPDFARLYTDRAALRRFGQPEEIAGAAVFLASEESSYLSGQTITIDGGYTAA